jgi:hypothetical protein
VLELGGMMLNCLGRDAGSTLGGMERLYKLPIGRVDERKVMVEWIGRLWGLREEMNFQSIN